MASVKSGPAPTMSAVMGPKLTQLTPRINPAKKAKASSSLYVVTKIQKKKMRMVMMRVKMMVVLTLPILSEHIPVRGLPMVWATLCTVVTLDPCL